MASSSRARRFSGVSTSTLRPTGAGGLSRRPVFEHTPLPSATSMKDTKQIEDGLQKLRTEFTAGKMQAFGGPTRKSMDKICQLQQALAKDHMLFDAGLDHKQAGTPSYTTKSQSGISDLMTKLSDLSTEVRNLRHSETSAPLPDGNQTDTSAGASAEHGGAVPRQQKSDHPKRILRKLSVSAV